MRGWNRAAWAGLVALAAMSGTGRAAVVELERWAGEGVLLSGRGLGMDLFQLIAEARWDKGASRDPDRYLLQLALPDGQIVKRGFPIQDAPPQRRFMVYIPAAAVRNLPPSRVKVGVSVVDAATGQPLSNVLDAGIDVFPRPRGNADEAEATPDTAPFGRGQPLNGPARVLPKPGPDGLQFARISGGDKVAGFYLATTEASNRQVGERLKGYDPKAGRSDEFLGTLEGADQPALNLTPARAQDYLKALGQTDAAGVVYRLPTRAEWLRAARSGKSSAFWWGDEPTHPEGANFLGPEPALTDDTTAPSQPSAGTDAETFQANPFGLFHTFGNVAEWATDPAGGFVRLGGQFRTEPVVPLPELAVARADQTGDDAFVGVRPAFDLSAQQGADLARKQLAADPNLAGVAVAFDPDRATLTLTGQVPDASARRAADTRLEKLWFVAAVDNRLETPGVAPNQLARLGAATGPTRLVAKLGRSFAEVPVSVRWLDPLPVDGSDWWVNVYEPNGGHFAHLLVDRHPRPTGVVLVVIDRDRTRAAGLADDAPLSVALSLGAPAQTPADPHIVSNSVVIRARSAANDRAK